jgi:hypothetical protein
MRIFLRYWSSWSRKGLALITNKKQVGAEIRTFFAAANEPEALLLTVIIERIGDFLCTVCSELQQVFSLSSSAAVSPG